jgi:hypothetical protein
VEKEYSLVDAIREKTIKLSIAYHNINGIKSNNQKIELAYE